MIFMKFLVAFLVATTNGQSLEPTKIDTTFFFNLFTRNSTYNTIKSGYPESILNSKDMSSEREVRTPTMLDEQCLIECLKNMHCVRYSFNDTLCRLRLHQNRRKIDDHRIMSKAAEIGIDLNSCANSIYCTSHTDQKVLNVDSLICDPVRSDGNECQYKVTYDFSEWSEWTSCNVPCDDGFRKRKRDCQRRYYNPDEHKNVTVIIEQNDWMCKSLNSDEESEQVEICRVTECKIYSEWTEWTSCSRICSGYRNRSRSCLVDPINKVCNPIYLFENEPCGLNDCANSIISLREPTRSMKQKINVLGYLILYNTETRRTLRLFTYNNNAMFIQNIAKIACTEFGLPDFNWVIARSANDIKKQFKGNVQDYLNYINEQSLNGLECDGTENSIKECHMAANATLDTDLFELELECVVDGYWSDWSAWSECSVTCGAGAITRTRTCSNPAPTVSEYKNGLPCAGNPTNIEQCTKPRCRNQKGPLLG